MLFPSISFLNWFLPLTVLAYFLAPGRGKNPVLLLASLVFYFWGEPVYIIVMLLSALSGWVHALLMDRSRRAGKGGAKALMVSCAAVSLGALAVFKYSDFFISNVNALTGAGIPLTGLVMPIGISFYTFQILSYDIDVYRGRVGVQRNPLDFFMYVTLFPQLIAGPVVRYQSIAGELAGRRHSLAGAAAGVRRFCLGLAKKVLIANTLAQIGEAAGEPTVLLYWLKSAAFTLQIYFDFSGYSDMAIGLGLVFGFHFPENFDYPYISRNVSEFWRRWHMSLGSWFRDYVYIPLGGNRVSKGKWFRNVLVVWLLTGFWHGAEWTFIVWGLMFALLLLLEKGRFGAFLRGAPAALGRAYVLFFVNLSFVIFNAADMPAAVRALGGMFGLGVSGAADAQSLYLLRSYGFTLLAAAVLATPAAKWLAGRLREKSWGAALCLVLEPLGCLALLILAAGGIVDGSFNPFLYFRF
ncbi:MAG: MBOAT family protein [Butyricicoccus sp.]|nr:MBOAT family protein [Butyricicoccus sp.]